MEDSNRYSPSAKVLQAVTIVAILAAIVVNALSNIFPINGLNVGQIANTILGGVLITPANYAFAIWGVIYLGLIAFGIYQALPSQRYNSRLQTPRIAIIAASLFQMAWIFLFQLQQFWVSVVLMLGILFSLAWAFLGIHTDPNRISRQEKWFVQIPISVYFAWISVATIVNVASALYASGWAMAPIASTVILLLIAAAIAVLIAIRYHDAAFTLVFVWAFIAIAVRQASQPAIVTTATGLAIALAVLILFTQVRFGPKLR
jgi:uncharacterized membrane protein YhaH (DUF805 family)